MESRKLVGRIHWVEIKTFEEAFEAYNQIQLRKTRGICYLSSFVSFFFSVSLDIACFISRFTNNFVRVSLFSFSDHHFFFVSKFVFRSPATISSHRILRILPSYTHTYTSEKKPQRPPCEKTFSQLLDGVLLTINRLPVSYRMKNFKFTLHETMLHFLFLLNETLNIGRLVLIVALLIFFLV